MGYHTRCARATCRSPSGSVGTAPAGLRPDWSQPVRTELYTHTGDDGMAPAAFDDYENTNLAIQPQYAPLRDKLLAQLRELVEGYIPPRS